MSFISQKRIAENIRYYYSRFSWWIVLNSFFAAATVSILLYYSYLMVQAWVAYIAGYPSLLFFATLEFKASAVSWTRASVFLIYLAPFLYCMAMAVLSYLMFSWLRRSARLWRLVWLWTHVVSVTFLMGSFIKGFFLYKGWAVILRWLNIPQWGNGISAIVATVALLLFGMAVRLLFVKLSPSLQYDAARYPRWFLIQVLALPAVGVLLFIAPLAWRVSSGQLAIMVAGLTVVAVGALTQDLPPTVQVRLVKNFPLDRYSLVLLGAFLLSTLLMLLTAGNGIDFRP